MKQLIIAALVAFAGATQATAATDDTAKESKKTLIVYYSWGGNTRHVVEQIRKLIDAEVYELTPEKAYPTEYHQCTEVAKREKENNARPALKGELPDLSKYDTVIVGFPIWWGTFPIRHCFPHARPSFLRIRQRRVVAGERAARMALGQQTIFKIRLVSQPFLTRTNRPRPTLPEGRGLFRPTPHQSFPWTQAAPSSTPTFSARRHESPSREKRSRARTAALASPSAFLMSPKKLMDIGAQSLAPCPSTLSLTLRENVPGHLQAPMPSRQSGSVKTQDSRPLGLFTLPFHTPSPSKRKRQSPLRESHSFQSKTKFCFTSGCRLMCTGQV